MTLNTQELPGDTTLANRLNQKAIAFALSKRADSAIYYFGQAAAQYESANAWNRVFFTHYQAGYQYNLLHQYAESFQYLDSIARNYSARLSPQLESYQNFYGVLAWSQFQLLKFEQALYYFNLIDQGAEQNQNVKPTQILFSKYYQGVIYQRIGQYDQALKYMLLTRNIGYQYDVKSYLGRTYNNLGIIYRNLGEHDRALEFYKKALEIEKQYKQEISLTPLYNNLGLIYYYRKEYDAALKELDYALDVLKSNTPLYYTVESALINTKALVLIDLGDYSQAKRILDEVLAREIGKNGKSWAGSALTLHNLGVAYAKIGEFKISNQYYDEAIAITQKVLGYKTDKLSDILNLKSQNFLQTKNYDAALQTIQQSLISLVTDFNDSDYQNNPDVTSIILDKVELIESQYIKTKILLALFKDTSAIEYLKAAKASNQTAALLIEIVRKNMLYESSKMNLAKRAKANSEQTILIALMLEKEVNIPAAISVLEAMENSKAYLLSEVIQKAKALGYSNLPESVLVKEDSFRTKIKVLELMRNNILLHSQDTTALAQINQRLFSTKELLESYKHSNITKNRQYQHNMLSISSFQANFAASELIIEYFAGENMLYAIAINNKKVKVYELADNQELINRFVRSVKKVRGLGADDYQMAAYEVYNILLAPILADFEQAESLVIIPDKQLGFIPFDALVSKQIDNPKYNNLAYLLKNYTLMQHQTVALYVNQKYSHEQAPKQFIGFAPDFDLNDLMVASNNQLRSALQPLPYARKEVEAISNLLEGEEEIGSNASEANLKTKASSFNILHLATHAIIDEENPIYSKLIFNFNDSSLDEDGELHSFEIHSMKLNAALVTLSACNTGTGKYLDGEGVFSLGRSFLLAGAESVLTSLWEVSDQSTSQIMESFYTYIKEGVSSPEALRQAKLAYLNTADQLTANPHYWAAFVYIGRPEAIYESSVRYYWVTGILLLFIGFTIIVMKARKKQA